MIRRLCLALALIFAAGGAEAACTLPYTLTAGTLASASQVMANFNALNACINTAAASNILSYGLTCDGVTDDSLLMTNLAATGTGNILIPSGKVCVIGGQFSFANAVSFEGADLTSGFKVLTGSSLVAGGFLAWQQNKVTLQNLTIDVNNVAAPTPVVPIIQVYGNKSDLHVRNVRIINAPSHTLLVSLVGIKRAWIEDSFLALTAGALTQNQCINVSDSGGTPTEIHVVNNVCENTSMLFAGTYGVVSGNDVYGHGYGSGIASGPDATTGLKVFANNRVHDSIAGVSDTGVEPGGLEIWDDHAIVVGNQSWKNSGDGYTIGGKFSMFADNLAWDNGTCTGGGCGGTYKGFSAAYNSASLNASSSKLIGNYAWDTGGATQKYGYAEDSRLTGMRLDANSFTGSTAAMQLNTTSTQGENVWQAWVPTQSAAGGNTVAQAITEARFSRDGKTVRFTYTSHLTFVTSPTSISFTLPSTPASHFTVAGIESGGGTVVAGVSTTATMAITQGTTGTFPSADTFVTVMGQYEETQ